jgi:hypothetical protein
MPDTDFYKLRNIPGDIRIRIVVTPTHNNPNLIPYITLDEVTSRET